MASNLGTRRLSRETIKTLEAAGFTVLGTGALQNKVKVARTDAGWLLNLPNAGTETFGSVAALVAHFKTLTFCWNCEHYRTGDSGSCMACGMGFKAAESRFADDDSKALYGF